jgi:hypothetical protein
MQKDRRRSCQDFGAAGVNAGIHFTAGPDETQPV